jgi:hypothetical protein
VILNNSRETVTCDCSWSIGLTTGRKQVTVVTGHQERVPVRFAVPAPAAPDKYDLNATVTFDTGETQRDSFTIHVLPPLPTPMKATARIALFDPKGESRAILEAMRIPFQPVDSNAELAADDVLVVGKSALTVDGPAPRIGRVRDGLKVIVLEQNAEVLEKRLGFRVVEYGSRQVFPRVADHPVLTGIAAEHLRDWRGEATLLPSRLDYEMRPRYGPTVRWCDIPVTRVWRCGNRGNVASVLIEKPARGDFLPILDGGYSLQYSPLLEYREGQGLLLFCQLDLTGRTETDPAAELLTRNILQYASSWKSTLSRKVVYAGDPAGMAHLESAGFPVAAYDGAKLTPDQILVVGPGQVRNVEAGAPALADWLKSGGHLLGVGLDEQDANAFLPLEVRMKKAEHISAYFDSFEAGSLLAGTGPADVHTREPRDLPLVTGGATVIGDGVLARVEGARVVFCQLVPWQFDYGEKPNVKRTYRRASFLVSRLLANMGARSDTLILDWVSTPLTGVRREQRWREGLYLDQPEEWDDPYRFFRW